MQNEKEKGEGTKITVNRTTVIFHTAEFKSKGSHPSIILDVSLIIKHKSYQDEEMIKEAFTEVADSLFWDFKNKEEKCNLLSKLFSYQEVQLYGFAGRLKGKVEIVPTLKEQSLNYRQ